VSAFWVPHAWLDGSAAAGVRLVERDGRWATVERDTVALPGDSVLPGLALPGFANTHSHAFHRALRGRTHGGGGSFWTWREQMYLLAGRLDPDSYLALARAVYAEMALAGVAAVGEFHYLHHRPGGDPYPDPNAVSHALMQAAAEAGIRLTLLDTCYLTGGLSDGGYLPLSDVQRRFTDGSAAHWAERAGRRQAAEHVRLGAAIHSVRAVPADQLEVVVQAAAGAPLHVHVSEQPAENEATAAVFGCTPTELLARHGFGGATHTAVHATHLSRADIAWYGRTATNVSFCPTTERDLADGIGPAGALVAAGAPLSLGSDQNAQIDLLAEAQALEFDERLATLHRGRFTPAQLVDSLTADGHRSLGWPDAGRLAPGYRADLVSIRLDTARTAGSLPEQLVLTATAPDIDTVVVGGRQIVSGGQHVLGDVGRLAAEAISSLWS
jgi:formiminoglutamate deiminase